MWRPIARLGLQDISCQTYGAEDPTGLHLICTQATVPVKTLRESLKHGPYVTEPKRAPSTVL